MCNWNNRCGCRDGCRNRRNCRNRCNWTWDCDWFFNGCNFGCDNRYSDRCCNRWW